MKKVFLFLIVVFFLAGCAGKKAPHFARIQPVDGISATHPDEMLKSGGYITTFTAIMPPQFLVEARYGVKGIWPVVADDMSDENAPLIDGFCFAMEDRSFDHNPWGFIILKCVFTGAPRDFSRYKFALVNKDGGVWMASPIGKKIIDDKIYDFQKFESDFKYRKEILEKVGASLREINVFWQVRASELGMTLAYGDVARIPVNSHSLLWQDFRKEFIAAMGYELTLPNGKHVVSVISRDEMVTTLARNPRITPWQKFLSRLVVPLGTPEVMAIGAASSVLNGGIAALLDTDWHVRVARGTVQLRETSAQMVYLMHKYEKVHQEMMRYKLKTRGEKQ